MEPGDVFYVNCYITGQRGGPHVVSEVFSNHRVQSDTLRVSVPSSRTYSDRRDFAVSVLVDDLNSIKFRERQLEEEKKALRSLANVAFGVHAESAIDVCGQFRTKREIFKDGDVSGLELTGRTARILSDNDITTMDQLNKIDEETIKGWHGCGRKTLLEIIEFQTNQG